MNICFLKRRLNQRKSRPKVNIKSTHINDNKSLITGKKNFNVTTTKYLLEEYEKNKYPDRQSKDRIALKLNLTSLQVQYWFENRRKKLK